MLYVSINSDVLGKKKKNKTLLLFKEIKPASIDDSSVIPTHAAGIHLVIPRVED